MTDIHTCDKIGCSNTFDLDLGEGIIVTKSKRDGTIIRNYYCCIQHKQ